MPTIKQFAAAYTRVSTDEQAEFSIDAQLRAIKDYAEKNGYTILPEHIYADEGVSGRTAEKRPAFMRMIAEAKQTPRPFDAIIFHKLDRFARSREDSVVYKSLLRKDCGVKVLSVTENIDDDKFSVILEAMLEAMAEYYSINLSEEVKKGMTEKARRGGLQTTPAFGYTVEENTLVHVDSEAEFVREIFRRFVSGEGFYQIARWLNGLGIKTHRGSKFENRTIEYIIRNPVYIGQLRWNPSGRSRRDFDHPDIIVADAKHEPIIDQDTWDAAQLRVAEVKSQWVYHGRPITEKKDWISGIVRCATCENTLVFSKPHYWKCNAFAKGSCRTSQHISDESLKNAFFNQLHYDAEHGDNIDYKPVQLSASGINETAALEMQRDKIIRSRERLREAYLIGAESADEYKLAKATLEAALEQIEKQIKAHNAKLPVTVIDSLRENIRSALVVLESPTASKEEKNRVATNLIERCTFDKSKNILAVQYRFVF